MDQTSNSDDFDSKSSIELLNAKNYFNEIADSPPNLINQTNNEDLRLRISTELANEALDATSSEVYQLLASWGLSLDAIEIVIDCRVNSLSRLTMLNVEDINEIFNSRYLIEEKACFRYQLQKWRNKNNYEPLTCTTTTTEKNLPNLNRFEELIDVTPTEDFQFNLREILQKTVDGVDIFKKYSITKTLNDKDQNAIVRIVVDYFLLKNIKMDPKVLENLAMIITKLFPTESAKTYYIPRTRNKNACGKLYDRYYNQKNKRRYLDVTPTSSKKCKTADEPKPLGNKNPESLIDKVKFETLKKWLLTNSPKSITTPWKSTSFLRMQENKIPIENFLNEWPRYKDPKGYELINIDFETIQPGNLKLIFEKINELEKVMIIEIFPDYVKDKVNMIYLQKMKETMNINTKHLYFFYLLHAVITPPRVNKTSKPSITDAQSDMIFHLNNLNDLEQKKIELKELALQDNSIFQPKIFVIGETLENLTDFLVIFNDIMYKVNTLLHAVDLIIKMCCTFNLQFSTKSKYVWIFLQEYIYEILSWEKISKVQNILNKVKNCK